MRFKIVPLAMVSGALILLSGWATILERPTTVPPPVVASSGQRGADEAYGRLPLAYELNVGQADPAVRFVARTAGGALYLTATGAVLANGDDALGLRLEDATTGPSPLGEKRATGTINYLRGGSSPSHVNVPSYGEVRYPSAYPGIDLVWHGTRAAPEYDFIVHPGANPDAITVIVDGATSSMVDANGDLVSRVGGSEVRQNRPTIYQDVAGTRRSVEGAFAVDERGRVKFVVGPYDRAHILVIDPLVYSTYLGGSANDEARAVVVDSGGSTYVTGTTASPDFPISGGLQIPRRGSNDVFVTKFNPSGTALVYSTYLGGTSGESGTGIALDASGNVYLAGTTQSTDFPTTAGAFRSARAGGTDGFVAKLNGNASTLLYSSYLGGTLNDDLNDLAIDSTGGAYVTGTTFSTNFPTTPGAFRTAAPGGPYDGFAARIDTTGSGSTYSTYLGGSGPDELLGVTVDGSGNAYITGVTQSTNYPTTPGAYLPAMSGPFSGVVTKLNPTGTAMVYSTHVAGGTAIAVDGGGNAYITGSTNAANMPTTPGAFQTTKPDAPSTNTTGFVTKLNAAGAALVYSTWLGGTNGADQPTAIAVDSTGRAYVVGAANSTTFPVVNAVQTTHMGGFYDGFVTVVNAAGSSLDMSTFLGGSQSDVPDDLALDGAGNIYVVGNTGSSNFPVTPGVFQPAKVGGAPNNDAFVTKMSIAGTTPPFITGSTWYSDGTSATTRTAGAQVRAFATGAFENVPYLLILSTSNQCTFQLAVLNPTTRFANTSGFIGTTVGTIPAATPPGTYFVCFKSTVGEPTATGLAQVTITA